MANQKANGTAAPAAEKPVANEGLDAMLAFTTANPVVQKAADDVVSEIVTKGTKQEQEQKPAVEDTDEVQTTESKPEQSVSDSTDSGEVEESGEEDIEEVESGEGDEAGKADDINVLKEQIAALQAQLQQTQQVQPQTQTEEQSTPQPNQGTFQQQVKREPLEVFGESDNLEEIVFDRAKLNDAFQKAATKAEENAIISVVPMLQQLIPQYVQLIRSTEKYFDQNQDLAPISSYFGNVLNEVRTSNQKLSFTEQLELAGKTTRDRLKMAKAAQKAEKTKPKVPAVNRSVNKLPNKTDAVPNGFQKQINDMLEALS